MNINRVCDRIIEYSFYALMIIVPLILTPYNYELFEFNKMLTVYWFTIIISGAWLIKMIINKKILLIKTPFDIPIILFLASQIMATIFSIDIHTSLWGYYSRFHGGLMSTICYIILFYAYITNNISAKKSLKVILSTAMIVSLYGIAEHFGIDKKVWVQDVQSRVFSTLGQPNWLAAYLIALVPLSYWLSPLLLLTIYWTKSQSGIGATVVTLLLCLIFLLIKNRIAKIILITVFCAAGLFYAQSLHLITSNKNLEQMIVSENQNRLGGSSSMLIRRVVWQGAINIWKHYPIFGSGVETFAYSYYNFRPAAHNLLSEWDFLYNKAHNEYVNYLATTGAFGFLSYLILIISFLIFFLKHQNNLGLGFVSILITNFFGFSVVPVALFFWFFPAMAFQQKNENHDTQTSKNLSALNTWQYIAFVFIALIVGYGLRATINTWQADRLFTLGRNYMAINQISLGFNYLQQSVILSPHEPLFRSEYAESLAKMAYLLKDQNATQSAQLVKTSLEQSDLVTQANPVHLNYWKSKIKIYLLLSNIDKKYTQNVLESIQQAITLAPTDAKLWYNLALVYNQLNQTELTKQTLEWTLQLKPNYLAAQEALAKL